MFYTFFTDRNHCSWQTQGRVRMQVWGGGGLQLHGEGDNTYKALIWTAGGVTKCLVGGHAFVQMLWLPWPLPWQ